MLIIVPGDWLCLKSFIFIAQLCIDQTLGGKQKLFYFPMKVSITVVVRRLYEVPRQGSPFNNCTFLNELWLMIFVLSNVCVHCAALWTGLISGLVTLWLHSMFIDQTF